MIVCIKNFTIYGLFNKPGSLMNCFALIFLSSTTNVSCSRMQLPYQVPYQMPYQVAPPPYQYQGTHYFYPPQPPAEPPVWERLTLEDVVSVDEEPLGVGGNAVIYSGRWLDNEVPVAIKRSAKVAVGQDPVGRARGLANEVAIMKAATDNGCRHCVRFHGLIDEPENVAVLMELVDGMSLYDYYGEQFTENGLRRVMRQVFEGLQDLHAAGLLHRDIHWRNVLVNGDGDVRICDFGSATFSSLMADAHEQAGTAEYQPPEVLNKTVGWSEKADIWAAGIMFHDLLTKKSAFPKPTGTFEATWEGRRAKARAAASTPFNPAVTMKGFSGRVQQVFSACLELDPKNRLTASEILKLPFFSESEEEEDFKVIDTKPEYSVEGDREELTMHDQRKASLKSSYSPFHYDIMRRQMKNVFIDTLAKYFQIDLHEVYIH